MPTVADELKYAQQSADELTADVKSMTSLLDVIQKSMHVYVKALEGVNVLDPKDKLRVSMLTKPADDALHELQKELDKYGGLSRRVSLISKVRTTLENIAGKNTPKPEPKAGPKAGPKANAKKRAGK